MRRPAGVLTVLPVCVLLVAAACGQAGTRTGAAPTSAQTGGAPAAKVASSHSAAPAALAVGFPGGGLFLWPNFVAEQQGFFTQQGLKVKLVRLGNPSTTAAALISNSIQVGEGSPDAFIQAHGKGAGEEIVGQIIGTPPYSLVGKKGVTSWSALRGGLIAVAAPNNGAAIVFRLMAQAKGLTAKDYKFLSVGTTANRFAALKAGQVSGALLDQPADFEAIAEGYPLIGRSNTILPHISFITIGVEKSWATAHAATLERYLAAMDQAVRWIYGSANRSAVISEMVSLTHVNRTLMAKTYKLYVTDSPGRVLTKNELVDMQGLQNYMQGMAQVGVLPSTVTSPRQVVDATYSQKAAAQT